MPNKYINKEKNLDVNASPLSGQLISILSCLSDAILPKKRLLFPNQLASPSRPDVSTPGTGSQASDPAPSCQALPKLLWDPYPGHHPHHCCQGPSFPSWACLLRRSECCSSRLSSLSVSCPWREQRGLVFGARLGQCFHVCISIRTSRAFHVLKALF